jgi:hypothetical protein
MLGFPRIMTFELIGYPCEYPKYYIRIYQHKSLEPGSKILSKNVYLYLQGTYTPVSEMNTEENGDDDS